MIKEIHDKIITQWGAFTFTGGASMFSDTQKIYGQDKINQPNTLMIGLADGGVGIIGNTTDERGLGFDASYFELIESVNQSELTIRYDRMENILERMLDWIEKEPNDLSGQVAGVTLKNVRLTNYSVPVYETQNGLAVGINVSFIVTVVITPQLLS